MFLWLTEVKKSVDGGPCFKPLRLGAVFLCFGYTNATLEDLKVSNPCASGRCSSGKPGNHYHKDAGHVSNPCASGRCSSVNLQNLINPCPQCFKPLRLGAVFL